MMRFELWRQDDNGNRFLVGAWPERAPAEKMLEELARHPHKQMYWIVGRSTESSSDKSS
jgi:hypothetical protein